MKIRQLASATVLGLALILGAGCGGSSSESGSNPAAFAGNYVAAYNRAGGTILIEVRADGNVHIAVNDETAGYFTGTGTIQSNNGFNVVCSGAGAATVTVSGNLTGSGAGRTATGTVSGTFNVAYTASFTSEPNHSVFAGDYAGTFAGGGDQGEWFGTVNSQGQFTGEAISEVGPFQVTGTLSSIGSATISGTAQGQVGSITVTFSGSFRLLPNSVECSGGWSSSTGANGSWEGHRVIGQG